VFLGVDGRAAGSIAIADPVKRSTPEALAGLRADGVRLVMATGDHRDTAACVARQLGIDEVHAGITPEEKHRLVTSLKSPGRLVGMAGDGINDAPALAAADVGIAIGGATGTTQAMETADVTLMSADLRQLPFAVRLSRAAMRTIRVNVALSIGIKLAFLVVVLLGWGTMWMAVLADMGTALLVTLNGMRLLRFGRDNSNTTTM
jgi:Cd2+/Zn2+-exporting ATPase